MTQICELINRTEIGELINMTQIINTILKFKDLDSYGANEYTYYYSALFKSTKIKNNIPVIYLNNINQYILLELTIPNNGFVDNVNFVNITPYFYSYEDVSVFASVDISIEFFKPKLQPGDRIKIIFTSSKTIGDHFKNEGYLISMIPYDYILKSTFNFLIRIGNLTGSYNPGSMIKNSKVIFDVFESPQTLLPYTSLEIIKSFPTPLGSKYSYEKFNDLNVRLLILYDNEKNKLIKDGCMEIPTYLYLQNIPNPPVKYAFQSFYDSISVNPYIQMQANNTGESYFNSELIKLSDYSGLNLIILAVNQNAYGYGIYSNIQIYNNLGLSAIPNGSYLTSPNIPVISSPTYPYIDQNDKELIEYPLINKKIYIIDDLLSQGIKEIFVIERVGYNPINFYHPDDYKTPRLSVFVSK